MDFVRPIEALIPGVRGKVLGVLSRSRGELTLRGVAELAEASPTQTSRVLGDLVHLGVVSRRDVPPVALFRLVDGNVAADMVRELGSASTHVTTALERAARAWAPAPAAVVCFGSFARGEADADSDIDVLVVRPDAVGENDDEWAAAVERWTADARTASGNPVRLLEVAETELRDHLDEPRGVWRSIVDEGVSVLGPALSRMGVSGAA